MPVLYRKTRNTPSEEENPYWMSFSDMMAGILIIFILVCSVLVFKLSQMDEQVKDNIQQLVDDLRLRDAMLEEVRLELARLELYVDVEDDSIIVPEQTLDFDSGSFAIRGKNIYAATALGQFEYSAHAESKTDSRPAQWCRSLGFRSFWASARLRLFPFRTDDSSASWQ